MSGFYLIYEAQLVSQKGETTEYILASRPLEDGTTQIKANGALVEVLVKLPDRITIRNKFCSGSLGRVNVFALDVDDFTLAQAANVLELSFLMQTEGTVLTIDPGPEDVPITVSVIYGKDPGVTDVESLLIC